MEGLIPFVYRAIVEYKNGGQGGVMGSTWMNETSPSASYMRLPTGDSGRFDMPEIQSDYGFSTTSSPPETTARLRMVAGAGVQSPARSYRNSTRAVKR